jgi:hypothetical protein
LTPKWSPAIRWWLNRKIIWAFPIGVGDTEQATWNGPIVSKKWKRQHSILFKKLPECVKKWKLYHFNLFFSGDLQGKVWLLKRRRKFLWITDSRVFMIGKNGTFINTDINHV